MKQQLCFASFLKSNMNTMQVAKKRQVERTTFILACLSQTLRSSNKTNPVDRNNNKWRNRLSAFEALIVQKTHHQWKTLKIAWNMPKKYRQSWNAKTDRKNKQTKNEVKNYKFVITIVFLLVTILDVHCACTIKMLLSCVVVCKILICWIAHHSLLPM